MDLYRPLDRGGNSWWIGDFTNFDVSVLRSYEVMHAAPPPGLLSTDHVEVEKPEVSEVWSCPMYDERLGRICGCEFQSSHALDTHMRSRHNVFSEIRPHVITNECPRCRATFSSRTSAYLHVRTSLRTGRCPTSKSRWSTPVVEPRGKCLDVRNVIITARISESFSNTRVLTCGQQRKMSGA